MDSQSERLPAHQFSIVTNTNRMRVVTKVTSVLSTNNVYGYELVCCRIQLPNADQTVSTLQVAQDVASDFWRTGHPPPDMPKCGFDGALCDYTNIYLIAAACLLCVLLCVGTIIILRYR
jgi:hypothetical protein